MDPVSFDVDIGLTLGVGAVALALFVWGRWRLEVVGLATMAALPVLGVITPAEAVAGFANEATVTVALMLGMSVVLVEAGVVERLGKLLERFVGVDERGAVVAILVLVVPSSALINNTAAVAILLPVIMGVCRRQGLVPSRLLMPLSFGSQFGGTLTLIGTSTNLLVAGMAVDQGLDRIGLFTITPPAAVLMVFGVLYLLTMGRWLTPVRESTAAARSSEAERKYLGQLKVGPHTHLLGETVRRPRTLDEHELTVLGVHRDGELVTPDEDVHFQEGDLVMVRGSVEALAHVVDDEELEVDATAAALDEHERDERRAQLAEMMVGPRARLTGSRMDEVRDHLPGDLSVLALERHGEEVSGPLDDVELEAGDVLLLRGAPARLRALHEEGELALLDRHDFPRSDGVPQGLAIAILVGVVAVAATGLAPIMLSALVGMALMLLCRCVRPTHLYHQMDWGVIVLLGSLLALGTAMERTGAASWLATSILHATEGWGPHGNLAAIYLLTTLLTSVVTNNAAAVVMTPIAIATAQTLELSPLPFLVSVMIAASNCFTTPMGYQTNTFIYGPGGYRFTDFLRVGGPLVLLMLVLATWVIPWFLPF